MKKAIPSTRLAHRLARRLEQSQKISKRFLKPKHKAYLRRWRQKLDLQDQQIALYVYDYKKDHKNPKLRALARIAVHVQPHLHALGLSNRTMKSTDWRDSVIHELLHIIFHNNVTNSRKLTPEREEYLVRLFAGLLARF